MVDSPTYAADTVVKRGFDRKRGSGRMEWNCHPVHAVQNQFRRLVVILLFPRPLPVIIEKQCDSDVAGHQSVSISSKVFCGDGFGDLMDLAAGFVLGCIRQYRCPLYHIRKMFNSVL